MINWSFTFKSDTGMYLSFNTKADNKYRATIEIAADLRKYAYDVPMSDILEGIKELK